MPKRITLAIRSRNGSTVYPVEGGDRIDEQISDATEVRLRIDDEPGCRLCGELESHSRHAGLLGHVFERSGDTGFEEFVLQVTGVRRISGRSTDYELAADDTVPGIPIVDLDPAAGGA